MQGPHAALELERDRRPTQTPSAPVARLRAPVEGEANVMSQMPLHHAVLIEHAEVVVRAHRQADPRHRHVGVAGHVAASLCIRGCTCGLVRMHGGMCD